MYVYAYVYIQVFMHVHGCVYAHMEARDQFSFLRGYQVCIFCYCFCFVYLFLDRVSHWDLGSLIRLGWLARKILGSACLHLWALGLWIHATNPSFSHECLEFESLCSHSNHVTEPTKLCTHYQLMYTRPSHAHTKTEIGVEGAAGCIPARLLHACLAYAPK